jgi:hypothetical protein
MPAGKRRLGDGMMRFLKVLTIVMGVLIVLATTVLIVVITRRLGTPAVPVATAVLLDEPAGTHIVGIASVGDRLAVQLQGGGPDRVLLFDVRTGAVAGRVGVRGGDP